MRFLFGFVFLLAGNTIVQCQSNVPQTNDFNAKIALIPKLQSLTSQMNNILLQVPGILSQSQLQSLQQQVTQTILSHANNGNINVNTIISNLHGLLQGYSSTNQLNTVLAQIPTNLSSTELQSLQEQAAQIVLNTLIQQRFDLNSQSSLVLQNIAQKLDNVALSLLPILISGLLDKRDLNVNYRQLFSQLPIKTLLQILQVVNNTDKDLVLTRLRQLLQSSLSNNQGTINFDDFASYIINNYPNITPDLLSAFPG
ncbi:unnamed protein product [Adineta steineri]|uniref:Uncharacterized protein n=1 Tax=Adineta steineri TaxID=433720 RepID=A0A815TY22_9BILA|nr:unnamed protein product [Adineta steineri]CAF4157490.1 unnamed protein product [Adineta steineri]